MCEKVDKKYVDDKITELKLEIEALRTFIIQFYVDKEKK